MPDKSPYATVIVPTHDRAATLASAVASVQRQTVANIEILIVGDGPTPAIVAVAEALTSADPRIQFLAFDKAPLDAGLNVDRAVHQASSERIFYTDDDDIWLPAHVETIGPHLDHVHIADTLPVSVGTLAKSEHQQLHGTLVNGGNSRIRRLLGANQLKLTFDTHIAHRKSSYIALGSPRAVTTTTSVTAMLAAFAADPRIRWRTLPTCTALSLHGAARIDLAPIERRAEIETWLARSAHWTPGALLEKVDFVWHAMRTWLAETPLAEDTVAGYFARYGAVLTASRASRFGDEDVPLILPLSERQYRAVETAFALFQGRIEDANETPDDLIVSILDGVLGGPISAEYAVKLLKPHGVAAAREICFRLRQQYPGIRSLVDLVEAYLLLESGSTAEARAIADRLDQESTLPTYDLTRLLVHCELGAGAGAAAIGRMQRMWQRRINPVHTGLELLPFLILAARVPEAMAVCRELEARVPGVPLLKQVRLTLDQMKVGLKAVPQYRLAQNGLIQPDGNTAVVSDGVTGHIDAVHVEDWCVFIAGWAVDRRARRSVNRVVVMLDGHAQGTATPSIKRADVAMALQLPEVEVSGFLVAVRLPDAALPSPPNLRVFVIAGDGAAHELAVPHTR